MEIRPWLDNLFEAFFKYKAWHAPIIAVNDNLISQGKFVNVEELRKSIKEKLVS